EAALSETRKATNSATSSGRPGLPIGIPPSEFINPWRAVSSSVPAIWARRAISPCAAVVSMKPGATVLTRTPLGPTSFDSPLLYVVNAALALGYASVASECVVQANGGEEIGVHGFLPIVIAEGERASARCAGAADVVDEDIQVAKTGAYFPDDLVHTFPSAD